MDAEYHKAYYERTKERRQELKRKNQPLIRDRNRSLINNSLSENPCVDCGEADPIVLEFDHLSNKKMNISDMMDYAWNSILLEIEKCVIRCANCHRRKTALEQGWKRG